jgi:methylglyoxal/glyoxal reductase
MNIYLFIITTTIRTMIGTNPNPTIALPSGAKIPLIGYGTYQLQGADCESGVRWALETGYTHIDTASIYRNEEVIGRVLKEKGISREKLFLTSKVAPGEQGYEGTRSAVAGMLSRLGVEYLDLVIIHWPGVGKEAVGSKKNAEIRRESWSALVELQQ